jgi:hypothetical protein
VRLVLLSIIFKFHKFFLFLNTGREITSYAISRGVGGLQNQTGHFGEGKAFLHCRELNPRSSSPGHHTMLTFCGVVACNINFTIFSLIGVNNWKQMMSLLTRAVEWSGLKEISSFFC